MEQAFALIENFRQVEFSKCAIAIVCGYRKDSWMQRPDIVREWLAQKLKAEGSGAKTRLAKDIGLTSSQISKILSSGDKERRAISWAELMQIEDYYGDSAPRHADRPELRYVPVDGEDDLGVQRGERYQPKLPGASAEVDSRSGAGRGQRGLETQVDGWSGERVVDEWVFPLSFHHEMRTQASMVWIMPVVGNSMEPELHAGDRVLVDTTHTVPRPDAVYVIDEGEGPEVKQIKRVRGSTPPQIEIISINPSYKPDIRPLSEVRIVGRVCGRVSRM